LHPGRLSRKANLVIPLTDLNTGHEVTYSEQLHDYVSAGRYASRGREVTGVDDSEAFLGQPMERRLIEG
jgi:hypothetical protein